MAVVCAREREPPPLTRAPPLRRARATPAAFAGLFGPDKAELKASVLELLSAQPFGKPTAASTPTAVRLALSDALRALEAANPTASPAASALLDGSWTVALVGAPAPGPVSSPTREAALLLYAAGFSPAVAALAVAERLPGGVVTVNELSLAVSPLQPRAVATADVTGPFNTPITLRLSSNLEAETGGRLLETWASLDVGAGPVALPSPLQYQRRLWVTYLDDSLAVVRDEGGAATVLTRAPGYGPPPPAPEAAAAAPMPPPPPSHAEPLVAPPQPLASSPAPVVEVV